MLKKVGAEYRLSLPSAMEGALRRYDRHFTAWRPGDYTPRAVKYYKFSPRQALFAVIGDFNGDKRLDVVLDGHNRKMDLTLCIISEGAGYGVREVSRTTVLSDPKTKVGYSESATQDEPEYKEYGLSRFLRYNPPCEVVPFEEKKAVKIANDAFTEVYFTKAAFLYYYKDGKFHSICTGD
ncbi:MAG: hypothetical protein RDV48_20570 [Candidatus Eremiobacteraeota bacterium]|nr:hypothetical protein [Candidatus Eremiobacteraeota bacterium]